MSLDQRQFQLELAESGELDLISATWTYTEKYFFR